MRRRTFLQSSLALSFGAPLLAAIEKKKFDAAAKVLEQASASGLVRASALFVRQREETYSRACGAANSVDTLFLLASISKTISVAALLTLFDQGEFQLTDPVQKFIPELTGGEREKITVQHLLTHVSGLPDQLPQNARLRASHAPLEEFVKGAISTPLLFSPGTQYTYSSMAILLAAEVAQRISGIPFAKFVEDRIYRPLGMKRSAMGLGSFPLESAMSIQVEKAAEESGAGDPAASSWDWNSVYWRHLGAPWGGAHGSVVDVGTFLQEIMHPSGVTLKPATAQLMTTNQNRSGLKRRGLGFDNGAAAGSPGCSEKTFGHTGSTGTLCWADPQSDTVCVVLTTLPGKAIQPHPRTVVSQQIAQLTK